METTRIKMKIGVHEFDAEGSVELVKAQFEAFMAAINAMQSSPTATATPPLNSIQSPHTDGSIGQPLLDRLFKSDGETLSLTALPKGEGATQDALLALIYGYAKIKGENTVTGTRLNKSARVSGVPVERIDRTMATCEEFVLAAGVRKARRYQLNNRGFSRAEEIIKAILQ